MGQPVDFFDFFKTYKNQLFSSPQPDNSETFFLISMASYGGGGGGGFSSADLAGSGFSAGNKTEQQQEQEEKRAQMEEARNAMLKSLLSPEAKERLNRVAIVKPENARAVEDHIIRLARAGKVAGKIEESSVIRLLEEVGKQSAEVNVVKKVTIQRKKRMDDDSDDEDF